MKTRVKDSIVLFILSMIVTALLMQGSIARADDASPSDAEETVSSEEEEIIIEAEEEDKPPVDEEGILNGSVKLTYGMFGAVGDGFTNDYEAIKTAHDYANYLYLNTGTMVTVYGEKGKKYYISTGAESNKFINVITNVDWQGCTLIFDDYVDKNGDGINDVIYKDPIFDVVPDMTAATGWAISTDIDNPKSVLPKLNSSTKNVYSIVEALKKTDNYTSPYRQGIKKDYDACEIWGAYIEDGTPRWIRKGISQNGSTGEMITFNSKTGELLSDVDFDYSNISTIRVFPIRNKGISIGNAKIITYSNNKVYPSKTKETYTNRNIRVRYTGNVILHDIEHVLDETRHPYTSDYQTNSKANLYYGIIDVMYCGYISLDNIVLNAHTPSLMPGTKDSYNGTYDLTVDNTAYLYMNRIRYGNYKRDIADDTKWGVMGTNQCKGFFVENSVINRIDAHRGVTDLYISNTVLGARGMTLTGQGYFYADSVTFDKASMPITLRQDYGASWDGDMYFNNITFNLPKDKTSYLIYAYNTEDWDFGYKTYFPNLYMNNVTINAENGTPSPVMFLIYDKVASTINSLNENNLYYFKGDIQVKNIKSSDIKSFNAFNYYFGRDDRNLDISNYGGRNMVTFDLDKMIKVNANFKVATPKFCTGTVSGKSDAAYNYLKALFAEGKQVINADYIPTGKNVFLFSDVLNPDDYFYDPVYWAYENGITKGTSATSFSPKDFCTREQFVTFLWRYYGSPEPARYTEFSDVKSGAFYYKAVMWAADKGITTGYGGKDNRFGVGDFCTREQCVTFIYRAAGKPGLTSADYSKYGFDDAKKGYYVDAVTWAAKNGITTGVGNKKFGVGSQCTRGMLVTFLYRYSNLGN